MTQLAKKQFLEMEDTSAHAELGGQFYELPVRSHNPSEKKNFHLLPKEEAACNAATD